MNNQNAKALRAASLGTPTELSANALRDNTFATGEPPAKVGAEQETSPDWRRAHRGAGVTSGRETNLGRLPGAGGTQRLPRTIGTAAALMHILMGDTLTPREAERKGLVHETVTRTALDRAMAVARRLSSFPPQSVAYIKRLARNATEMPLTEGLALERNLFLKLCISEEGLARTRSSEEKITSPSRSFEVSRG